MSRPGEDDWETAPPKFKERDCDDWSPGVLVSAGMLH